MDRLTFGWDEKKDNSNLRKHCVSFKEASTVFSDELGRLILDPDNSNDEDRFILMGMSSSLRLLVVCHCESGEYNIRIISARKADRSERKQYESYSHA